MKQTVAAYIAKMLEQAGVKRIWGVTGDSLNGLSAVSYTHLPCLIAIHQHVPLDPHPAGEFDQWLQARLGEFNHFHPFSIKMMAALAGQLVDNPGFRLPLHQ